MVAIGEEPAYVHELPFSFLVQALIIPLLHLTDEKAVPPPDLRMPRPGRSSREKLSRQTIKLLHEKNDALIAENERLRRAWDKVLRADQ